MTTTITKTIKSTGGDYNSLTNWEIGQKANITAAGNDTIQVAVVDGGFNSSAANLVITTGWTTDPTHYIEIRAATGQEHTGVWSTSKAYMSSNGYIITSNQCLNVKRMQMTSTGDDYTCFRLSPSAGQVQLFDGCFVVNATTGSTYGVWRQFSLDGTGLGTVTVQNCITISRAGARVARLEVAGVMNIYNCTIRCSSGVCLYRSAGTFTSQNNYLAPPGGSGCYQGVTGGTNDATSNSEAPTANLRSIPYSTATFQNVTAGSENLRLVVSAANKLLDNGANLTAQGVTTDVIGTSRPQGSIFDIGAFENDIPLCWNYTARYKNSNKLFKASGCGSFPKNLKVPSNIDISTGKMIDDGILINPDEYHIV